MFTHKLGRTYSSDVGTLASVVDQFQGTGEEGYYGVVQAGAAAQEIDLAVPKASIVSLVLYSDQPITLKTNSSTVPQDTIQLAAKQMISWSPGAPGTCPFTNDVTKIFAANAGTKPANLRISVLTNISAS